MSALNQENFYQKQMDLCPSVRVDVYGGLGVLTIDRPEALNALTLDMIRALTVSLRNFEEDPAVKHVCIRGGEGRAFCAGGDLRSFYNAGMRFRRGELSLKSASLYFGEEYLLDRLIHNYSKPIISLMNGITMGGGYGLAGNCRYRIATGQTVFAMPEVFIGFFPDVGSIYHLLKCPDYIGHYLALTGRQLKAADMLYAGLADYYISQYQEDDFLKALCEAGDEQGIKDVIEAFSSIPDEEEASLALNHAEINRIFSLSNLEDIFFALNEVHEPMHLEARSSMLRSSPTSLCVTLEYLERAKGWAFNDVLAQDFILAQHFMASHDIFEGIRAVVIDKSYLPSWEPSLYLDVSRSVVESYFASTGYQIEDLEK